MEPKEIAVELPNAPSSIAGSGQTLLSEGPAQIENQGTRASNKGNRPIRAVKRWCWRLTATWYWSHLAIHVFWGRDIFANFETTIIREIAKALSDIGFNPGNPSVFPTVLKVGWVVTISNFSFIELTSLFLLYIPTFPFLMLLLHFFKSEITAAHTTEAAKPGLAPAKRSRGLFKIAIVGLVGWFLLYGNSYTTLPLCLGVALAGILFVTRSYSAFIYARPIDDRKSEFLDGFVKVAVGQATTELQKFTDKTYKKKSEIQVSLKFLRGFHWATRNLAWFMRGRRGRSRAALSVLMQYMATLLFLGATAVLFWGLMIRLFALPSHLPLGNVLLASASHILPGLNPPASVSVPLWIQVASSISAWILFVIYAGPAASIFPALQQAYMRSIDGYYVQLRSTHLFLSRTIRVLELAASTLQSP